MISYTIKIVPGTGAHNDLNLEAIRQDQGIAGMNEVITGFEKRGGKRFWADAANSVNYEVTKEAAIISVKKKGVRLRWLGSSEGGVRSTRPGGLMSLPADRGNEKSPRHYKDKLALIPAENAKGNLRAVLVEGEERKAKKGKRKGKMIITPKKGGQLIYSLYEWTDHVADKSVIDEEAIKDAAGEATKRQINLQLKSIKFL